MSILNGETYDDQSAAYAAFADNSFSWLHIERPGMDDYLGDYYQRGQDTQTLDIGCGSGRAIGHLIERGVPSGNITGLDPSINMLDIAARTLPQDMSLVMGKASEMPFSPGGFHLVIATMVLHAMDDQEAEATIGRVSDVLAPGGHFFFIDVNPQYNDEAASLKRWTERKSPWGTTLRVFAHDVDELIQTVAPVHDLECIRSGPLPIDEAGQSDDPAEYERYSTGNFRIAALLQKAER